jgi:branched-chain amino acid transport system substrate-binding protein
VQICGNRCQIRKSFPEDRVSTERPRTRVKDEGSDKASGKMFNRRLRIFAALLLLASPVLLSQANKPWIIGIVEPLSGPLATEGTRRDKVNKMWVADINAKGGIAGRKVQLDICDDEGKPEKAVVCARGMIDKGVVMIFSNSPTASTRAIQPLVRQGPPLIIPSPNVMPSGDSYGFQVSSSAETNTEAIASYLDQSGVHKIGMVATTDASGEAEVKSAEKVFASHHIELKLARIDLRATDASTQLATVAGPDVRVVYVSYSGGGAITVVKSYRNLGLRQPLIVSYGNVSQAFVQLVKDIKPPRLLAVGVIGLVPELVKNADQRNRTKAFMDAYLKQYGEPVDQLNLNARAQIDVAEAILRNVANPYDFSKVKNFLESTSLEGTRTEHFSPTNHVGPGPGDVTVVELKDGRWIKAGPIGGTDSSAALLPQFALARFAK